MTKSVAGLAAALAAIVFVPAQGSASDPQILGLIASLAPVPMTCDDERCRVEISTFCLQEHAGVPQAGTPYVLTAEMAQNVTVEGRTPAGGTVALPSSLLQLASERGNRALEMSVAADVVAEFGVTEVAVTVGDNVSALPATLFARADDPVVAQEIALATGPLRELGGQLVDQAGETIDAARLLGRLVNAVPDDRIGDVADRQSLWTEAIDSGSAAPSVDVARSRFDRCADLPGGGFITFRECLASQHDMLINPLNRAYWDAVDTGS